ncbi:hypothetical protein KSZ_66630 [Dictyobacter formicarum]|uniref:Cytochrome b561 bacterial/Ni-hydrogenase domain-containing protein n=1 Tax=Dictyobacter formicarum TaxID=2778368 RepID=A0ABQ3VS06_9CHLR|nr:hypothetical protein KSZ_66630 [Dictyobacter formicarum]
MVGSGYAACAWALLFAIANVYLQLGGPDPLQHWRVHHIVGWIMLMNLAVIPLKLLACLVALALVQPWGEQLSRPLRWLLLTAAWSGCAILIGYPLLGSVSTALVQNGLLASPPAGILVGGGFQLRVILYGSFFLCAGLLFLIPTWHYQRRTARTR